MKKILLISTVLFGSLLYQRASAQVSVHINVGVQPAWGPVGYDYVEYYYLPDIEAYYYVPRHEFVYLEGGRWIYSSRLPYRYRDYDLYSGYKVVVNEPRPYRHFSEYRERYAPHRHYERQEVIRDRRGYDRGRGYHGRDGHPGRGHAYGHDKHHGHRD